MSVYETVGAYVENWLKMVNQYYELCIVGLKLKYDIEKNYRRENVIYSVDGDGCGGIWEYDWWKGEQEVYIVGIIPISEIEHFMPCPDVEGQNFYE